MFKVKFICAGLLLVSMSAHASLMVRIAPAEERVNYNIEQVSSGSGTVTSVTSSTVRIDNNIYMYSTESKIKAATYPYRELKLEKGMKIQFKALGGDGGGLKRLIEATVQ